MIPFATFPSNVRVPLVGIEFDTSRLSNGGAVERKALIIGQRFATGSVAAGVLTPVPSFEQGDGLFGRGSMLANMVREFKLTNRYADVYAIALDEDAAGVKAIWAVVFTGPATAAGTLCALIGGLSVKVAVTKDMTPAQVATAFAAAVTALGVAVAVTAAVDGVTPEKVNLTCRWKGATGNDIDIRFNYYLGEAFPAGIGAAVSVTTAGATNPDLATAIAAFGDERWDTIVSPFTDAANMTLLEAELLSRWENLRVKAGLGYTAFRGNHSDTSTFGNTRNSGLISCFPTNISPDPSWIWAAVDAAVCDAALAADPARQCKTLLLPRLKAPAIGDRWDDAERNLHLFDGISSFTVDSGGNVRIERQVTMYQTNASGVADDALLDITTPATMIYMAIDLAGYLSSKYPRHKLADDGTQFGEGQPVVTPRILAAEFLMKALEWEERGIVENVEQFKADLVVERDPDNRNRVNALCPPDLVNNLMQLAILLQPRL